MSPRCSARSLGVHGFVSLSEGFPTSGPTAHCASEASGGVSPSKGISQQWIAKAIHRLFPFVHSFFVSSRSLITETEVEVCHRSVGTNRDLVTLKVDKAIELAMGVIRRPQ